MSHLHSCHLYISHTSIDSNRIATAASPRGCDLNHLYVMEIFMRQLLTLAIALAVSIGFANPASALSAIDAVMTAAGDGSGHILRDPTDILIGSDGDLYVASRWSDIVFRVDLDTNTVNTHIDASANGSMLTCNIFLPDPSCIMERPQALAMDTAGNLFVAYFGTSTVERIEPDGTTCTVFDAAGDGTTPALALGDITTAPNGDLFVASQGNATVFHVTMNGCTSSTVQNYATVPQPKGLAVATDGTLYVASFNDGAGHANVYAVAAAGAPTLFIDGPSVGLVGAVEIAIAPDGTIYVTGLVSGNVAKRHPSGTAELAFTLPDPGNTGTMAANGIAIDAAGILYVSDRSNNKLYRFDGTVPVELIGPQGAGTGASLLIAGAVAVDSIGRAYVASEFQDAVIRHTEITETIDSFMIYKSKATSRTAKFQKATNIASATQFEDQNMDLIKQAGFGLPADVLGSGTVDDDLFVMDFKAKTSKGSTTHERQFNLEITNALEIVTVHTKNISSFLVPANASGGGLPFSDTGNPPNTNEHGLDYYKCYGVVTSRYPKYLGVPVQEAFESRVYDLVRPTRLCVASSVNLDGSGMSQMKREEEMLLCYKAKRAKGQPKHTKRSNIHVRGSMSAPNDSLYVNTAVESELCVPSFYLDMP